MIDETRCTRCGRCAEVCEYHALAVVGLRVLVFPALCHGCGSCLRVCPEGAISERQHGIGRLSTGVTAGGCRLSQGLMHVGEPMATPIVRALKRWPPAAAPAVPGIDCTLEIRDAPPGASCPVVETMRGADYLLLVTEPTPFGLHDLRQVVPIADELGIPAGVVINREGIGDAAVAAYCEEAGLPVLMRIPMERRFAEAIAAGRTLVEVAPEYGPAFRELLATIRATVAPAAPVALAAARGRGR